MPPVQIPEQKAKIPGKLILGAFVTKPPIKDDDICPVDSDINIQIDQLDGKMSIAQMTLLFQTKICQVFLKIFLFRLATDQSDQCQFLNHLLSEKQSEETTKFFKLQLYLNFQVTT